MNRSDFYQKVSKYFLLEKSRIYLTKYVFFFIPDSFVNSQEWTAARGVTELRVGVLGSPDSGKSALVHRYLTGSYMQEESPEGWF